MVNLYGKPKGIFNNTKFIQQTVSPEERLQQNLFLSSSCSSKNIRKFVKSFNTKTINIRLIQECIRMQITPL